MSLPGLKSSVELEPGPMGPQLIDRVSGQKLPISEMESQVLALWDGAQTATTLSARLFVEGIDIEPWQVEQFFVRLARAQVLGPTAPVVPDFVPAGPGVEEPGDIVPMLRGDLIIAKSAQSKGTLEVKDPVTERSFTLYDFEVSIARMLDGKRSAQEVLDAANRLGIPVTLPTLKTFLQQLKAYQFIDASVTGGESTWPKRKQWSVGVRELYQSALRLMRAGKYDEARGYVDAMIEADPANEEAAALRQRIYDEAMGAKELSVPFDTLHTPVPSAESAVQPEAAPDPFASFGFHSAPPSTAELPPIPQEVDSVLADSPAPMPVALDHRPAPVPAPPSIEPVLPPAPARSRRPLFIGAAVVGVVLIVLLRPVEGLAQFPCELQVDELAIPRAPFAGPVGPPIVAAGTRVEKGAVLARLTLAPEETPEGLEARIKELETKLAASRPPATAKELLKAKSNVKKATAAVASLTKKKKKATKKALPAIEAKRVEKQTVLDAAKATLEAMMQPDLRAEWTATLEELTSKKVAAAVRSERSVITAPTAGLFLAPATAPEQLAENDSYGRIVAPTFRAVTNKPLVTEAESAVFVAAAGRVDVKLERSAAGVSARVQGEVRWVGAKGTLEVPSGRTPWLLSALR
ncbi:MAG: hypothetical protein Q8K32_04800 [Archangium sp.]|nr:hypothetical protein [Archangium sp.]